MNHRPPINELNDIPVFISLVTASTWSGICLALHRTMGDELLCDHCERILTIKAYRVVSEDPAGGTLLSMLVCEPCQQQAHELGLQTREINLDVMMER